MSRQTNIKYDLKKIEYYISPWQQANLPARIYIKNQTDKKIPSIDSHSIDSIVKREN